MDRKSYAIGLLSLSAVILTTALLVAPTNAVPVGTVVRDRDFTMMTASVQGGGDALYILDNRRGMMAVFTYDNASQSLRLRAAEPISNAFGGAAAGGGAGGAGGAGGNAPRRQ
jgi:hypothetical protein